MSDTKRPTPTEKADATDRFITALDDAHAALGRARAVLREFQPTGSHSVFPMFPLIGDTLNKNLNEAQAPLWAAHKVAAVQGYDAYREVRQQTERQSDSSAI